jgi:DNA-binding beta-propeller fold protein YncE
MRLSSRILTVFGLGISVVLIGASPSSTSTERSHGLLLVVNKADRTLSLVDPEAGREIVALPVGGVTAHEVAASPDGKTAWVPIYGNSGVGRPGTDGAKLTVIDLASRKAVDTIEFQTPTRPHCALFGPRDGKLYLTAELSKAIDQIDPATRKVVNTIPTGEPESHMLAISSDGKRGYTANVGSGTVSVLDLENKKLLKIIPISKTTQRIAISPDDRWVFTADQTKPELAVIDTAANSVSKRVPLPDLAFGTAPTHDGRWLLITQPGSSKVAVLNLQSMKVERTLDVPPAPQEILIRPDNQFAYVSCDRSKQVAVVNLSSWKVDKLIDVGAGADGLAWAVQH